MWGRMVLYCTTWGKSKCSTPHGAGMSTELAQTEPDALLETDDEVQLKLNAHTLNELL